MLVSPLQVLLTTLSVLTVISSEVSLLNDAIFYYVNVTPVTPCVLEVAITSFFRRKST